MRQPIINQDPRAARLAEEQEDQRSVLATTELESVCSEIKGSGVELHVGSRCQPPRLSSFSPAPGGYVEERQPSVHSTPLYFIKHKPTRKQTFLPVTRGTDC